jgi:hypothetical protein
MWWAIDMIKELPFVHYDTSTADVPSASSETTPDSAQAPVNAPGVDNNDDYCKGEDGLVPTENCEGFVFCAMGKMSGTITQCGPGLYFDVREYHFGIIMFGV